VTGRSQRRPNESFPRPRRAAGPVAGTLVALVAWVAVAHNSGAGWVQALGALLAGFLLVGLVAPAVAVRRARCAVVDSPRDSMVGRPTTLTVRVSTTVAVRPLVPPGPESTTGRRELCPIPLSPVQRGVSTHCVLQVASAAPFGLLWWTKRVTLALPHPLYVSPPLGPPGPTSRPEDARTSDEALRIDSRVGESRGVRPYQPGDLQHWVHWPATAHAGTLMVREMEGPAARPVTVRAILPQDPDAADDAAGRALGTVAGHLAAGRSVVLVTAEVHGVVSEPTGTVLDAGRRLARALPRRPAPDRLRANGGSGSPPR